MNPTLVVANKLLSIYCRKQLKRYFHPSVNITLCSQFSEPLALSACFLPPVIYWRRMFSSGAILNNSYETGPQYLICGSWYPCLTYFQPKLWKIWQCIRRGGRINAGCSLAGIPIWNQTGWALSESYPGRFNLTPAWLLSLCLSGQMLNLKHDLPLKPFNVDI